MSADFHLAQANIARMKAPMSKPNFVLWWVPAGHIPTVGEAKERFTLLWEHGPTAAAFTFQRRFGVSG